MEHWYLIALLMSFVLAIYISVNQFLKLDPSVAMVYRGALLLLVLLPFAFFIAPVANPKFYAFVAVQSVLVYLIDSKIFKLSKTIGAEATSLSQPLSIIAVFFLWLLINPAKYAEVLSNKVVFGLEALCLLVVTYVVIKIKNAKASKGTISKIFPLIILGIFVDIMNKLSMRYAGDNLVSGVFYYNLILASIVGLCAVVQFKKEKNQYNFFSKKSLIAGSIIVFVSLFLTMIKNVAMYYTPNPAFVSAIAGMSPLWVVGINFVLLRCGVIKSYKRIDVKYTCLLVLAISAMIVLANS